MAEHDRLLDGVLETEKVVTRDLNEFETGYSKQQDEYGAILDFVDSLKRQAQLQRECLALQEEEDAQARQQLNDLKKRVWAGRPSTPTGGGGGDRKTTVAGDRDRKTVGTSPIK